MGLAIEAVDEAAPVPRATRLVLCCDGDHGLFSPEPAAFHGSGYIEQFGQAMRAGWKDTHRSGVRMIFGPCCSGKVTTSGGDNDDT